MTERYAVTVYHGESSTVFYVVDTSAPESEQPAVKASYRTRQEADACALRLADPE